RIGCGCSAIPRTCRSSSRVPTTPESRPSSRCSRSTRLVRSRSHPPRSRRSRPRDTTRGVAMKLTEEESSMRDGAEGDAVAAAMDLLIRYGDALGAERLVNTRNVAGTMTQPSPAKAQLVREKGWAKAYAVINLDSDDDFDIPRMKVPTCQLQHGFSDDADGLTSYAKQSIELQTDAESYYS